MTTLLAILPAVVIFGIVVFLYFLDVRHTASMQELIKEAENDFRTKQVQKKSDPFMIWGWAWVDLNDALVSDARKHECWDIIKTWGQPVPAQAVRDHQVEELRARARARIRERYKIPPEIMGK